MKEINPSEEIKSVLNEENKPADIEPALVKLDELGAVYVAVHFAGSGDSGEIYCVQALPKGDETTEYTYDYSNQIELDRDTVALIEEWVYERLERAEVDWYNNDGGDGQLEFIKHGDTWKYDFVINVHQYISECEHYEENVVIDRPAKEEGNE